MAKKPTGTADKAASQRDAAYYATRDFKGILARINRDGWKELKGVSIEKDQSFQDIMVEALNDFLEKNGRPRAVEGRVLPKD
jgi:hypothetical protein